MMAGSEDTVDIKLCYGAVVVNNKLYISKKSNSFTTYFPNDQYCYTNVKVPISYTNLLKRIKASMLLPPFNITFNSTIHALYKATANSIVDR